MTDSPNREQRPSLAWPILLIGAGILLLLTNLNILPGSSWQLVARLWPLVLIVLGIDVLIGRRSTLGMVLSALVTLALVAGVILVMLLAPAVPALGDLFAPVEPQSQAIQAPLGSARFARATIDWSSGTNRLAALPPGSSSLIEGEVDYYGDLVFDVEGEGERASILLDSRGTVAGFTVLSFEDMEWDVSLNPDVIYDLSMDSGSGGYEFDLSDLQLSDFFLDSGSGAAEVHLPEGSYRASFDSGSGSLTITLPAEAAVRLAFDAGSGELQLGSEFQVISLGPGEDGNWQTANYETAEERIILDIDGGSGSIQIRTR